LLQNRPSNLGIGSDQCHLRGFSPLASGQLAVATRSIADSHRPARVLAVGEAVSAPISALSAWRSDFARFGCGAMVRLFFTPNLSSPRGFVDVRRNFPRVFSTMVRTKLRHLLSIFAVIIVQTYLKPWRPEPLCPAGGQWLARLVASQSSLCFQSLFLTKPHVPSMVRRFVAQFDTGMARNLLAFGARLPILVSRKTFQLPAL
jgi:hypothetical protein